MEELQKLFRGRRSRQYNRQIHSWCSAGRLRCARGRFILTTIPTKSRRRIKKLAILEVFGTTNMTARFRRSMGLRTALPQSLNTAELSNRLGTRQRRLLQLLLI
jgi:hypothetical protein